MADDRIDDVSVSRAPGSKGVGMAEPLPGAIRPTGDGGKERADPDVELIRRAIKRFKRCVEAEATNRKEAAEDLDFKANKQWPTDIAQRRNAQKRPCLTINKVPTFLHQITNDQKQNRPAIHISPVGDRSDKNAAKVFDGLIRRIVYDSGAELAVDTAFESAVSIGWGYWRFTTEYENDESFNQVIVWRRVRNPFTVYLDPDCQDPNCADAKFGFVTELVDRDEFKLEWPDANPCNWQQGGVGEAFKEWVQQHQIRIAEYFEKVFKKRRRVYLSTGAQVWYDELPQEMLDRIKLPEAHPDRVEIMKSRDVETCQVKWYKLTCVEVLERTDWLGKYIPIVKVVGEEIDNQGKLYLQGAIRRMKDPQRMKNYWATCKTEAIALAPLAPYIMAEGQAEGHETEWKMANQRSFAVLFYKPTSIAGHPVPPPQRQGFTGPPAGIIEAEHGSEQDMMAVSGIRFDATKQERTMDESGVALQHLRGNTELGTFHYIDNLSSALKLSGQMLVDLIPKVNDTQRAAMILREDDTEQRVLIDPDANKPFAEMPRDANKPNAPSVLFNPTIGEYSVRVTVGPSYATRRIEAARSMMDFVRAFPQAAGRIGDLIAKYQDWPGAEEISARLVPPEFAAQLMKDLPPNAKALVANLMQQVQGLSAERQQLMKAVNEKQSGQMIDMEKIHRDFEAKVLKVIADVEKNAENISAKIVADTLKAVENLIKPTAPVGSAAPSGGGAATA